MRVRRRELGKLALAGAVLTSASSLFAQIATLNKGQQILASRGFQITGTVASSGDPYHWSTLYNTNFNAPLWAWTADTSQLAASPSSQWWKWFDYTTQTDLPAAEQPYKANLV